MLAEGKRQRPSFKDDWISPLIIGTVAFTIAMAPVGLYELKRSDLASKSELLLRDSQHQISLPTGARRQLQTQVSDDSKAMDSAAAFKEKYTAILALISIVALYFALTKYAKNTERLDSENL